MYKMPQWGIFYFCYTFTMSSSKRRSSLDRIEASVLEHIPERYKKAVVGVYRMGLSMGVVGIAGMVFGLLAIVSFFISKNSYSVNQLAVHAATFIASFGLAILGARYMRMKMNPPNAFGWALLRGLICLILVSFFGCSFVAILTADLAAVFGEAVIVAVEAVYLILVLLPLVILVNIIYYLLFAHKGYEKWYKDYAKRNHIGEEAKTVKKSQNSHKSDEYTDDDL